jgi:hypothetical protein
MVINNLISLGSAIFIRSNSERLTKHGLCVKCAFQFSIVDRNRFDKDIYICPNCHAQMKVSEMYVFEPLLS